MKHSLFCNTFFISQSVVARGAAHEGEKEKRKRGRRAARRMRGKREVEGEEPLGGDRSWWAALTVPAAPAGTGAGMKVWITFFFIVLSLALVGEGGIETSSVLSRGAVTSPLTGASLLAELGCSSPKLGVG